VRRITRIVVVMVVLAAVAGQLAPAGALERQTLRRGDAGPQVRMWQHMLNKVLGSVRTPDPVVEDGVFGPATERATRRFERDVTEREPPDGIVTTTDRLLWLGGFLTSGWQGDPPLTFGSWEPRVGHLQVALNVWMARRDSSSEPLWIDAVFGTRTERALRAFQSSAGLTPDGIAGPRTWSALRDARLLRFPPAGSL
jgi:peptidoglycan hydrolase-like protein with peptidoglycan-binding domain